MSTFKTAKGTELPILNLKGKPYLRVAHRIVWFREEKPDWLLSVEFVEKTDKYVLAKATITDQDGKIKAIAHKTEHFAHFQDAIEKAETGSIGRALAFIGYGTQFAPEMDEGDRLADAPIPAAKPQAKPAQALKHPPSDMNPVMTGQMLTRLYTLASVAGWSNEQVKGFLQQTYGIESSKELTLNAYKSVCQIFENKTPFEKAMGEG